MSKAVYDKATEALYRGDLRADMLRHPDDRPSIGLIICRGKKGLIAEYALRDMAKPVESRRIG